MPNGCVYVLLHVTVLCTLCSSHRVHHGLTVSLWYSQHCHVLCDCDSIVKHCVTVIHLVSQLWLCRFMLKHLEESGIIGFKNFEDGYQLWFFLKIYEHILRSSNLSFYDYYFIYFCCYFFTINCGILAPSVSLPRLNKERQDADIHTCGLLMPPRNTIQISYLFSTLLPFPSSTFRLRSPVNCSLPPPPVHLMHEIWVWEHFCDRQPSPCCWR